MAYPPPWFASFVALPFVYWYAEYDWRSVRSFSWLAADPVENGPFAEHAVYSLRLSFGAAIFGVVVSASFACWSAVRSTLIRWLAGARSSKPAVPKSAAPIATASFEELEAWLVDDRPIDSPTMDLFGSDAVARRLASRLERSWTDGKPSVTVVGELGAGKSTLLALTRSHLRDAASNVHVVPISVWPFDKPEGAIHGALEELVRATEDYVDAPALRGLANEYIQVIDGAGGVWGRLGALMARTSDPKGLLRRIDRVASAIDVRFVLWIEDLERFAMSPTSKRVDGFKLRTIRAFLHLVDELSSVTVVVASTNLESRFDTEKITRYVEFVPELSTFDVERILWRFREGCLSKLSGKVHFHSDESEPEDDRQVAAYRGYDRELGGSKAALHLLCRTPRRLKHSLRWCLEAWTNLAGEIDFDDLLNAAILRGAEPAAFAFVDAHVSFFRTPAVHEAAAAKQKLYMQLDRVIPDARRRRAVHTIVDGFFKPESPAHERKVQGIARAEPIDYWRRMVSAEVPMDSDQPYLKLVLNGDLARIVALAKDPETAPRIAQFAERLPWSSKVEALRLLLLQLLHADPKTWPRDRSGAPQPPGFQTLAQLIRASDDFSAAPVIETLTDNMNVMIRNNLTLVRAIDEFFEPRDQFKAFHSDLRDAITREMTEVYGRDPAMLARKLEESSDKIVLLRLVWGLRRVRENYLLPPFNEPSWSTFAKAILEAANIAPEAVLPQIAPMIATQRVGMPAPIVERERAARLFQAEEDLWALFSTEGAANSDDPFVRAVADAVRSRSAEALRAGSAPTP